MDIIPSGLLRTPEGISAPRRHSRSRGKGRERGVSYYVKAMTRGEGGKAKGTPAQAMDYLTDGHDHRKEAAISDGELEYIARMGEGWKTELEGGRIPMVGYGRLEGIQDDQILRAAFEDSCQPEAHSLAKGGKTGYLSIVVTIPKEVSLYAEGNREDAKAAMYSAIKEGLDAAFPGKEITAVAAIHTRNDNGEIHYHAHVLVAKYAKDKDSGKSYSLNSAYGGNKGKERIENLKVAWKNGIEEQFKERLNLGIEQTRKNGPVRLHLPDGKILEPLNRESRRLLEKHLEPTYSRTTPTGEIKTSILKLNEMDARIYEVAAANRGKAGWDIERFKEQFPDQTKFVDRYEKRIEALKQVGYLNSEGRITQDFKNHHAAKYGENTPELQRIRIEIASKGIQKEKSKAPTKTESNLWDAIDRSENLRRRIERLGYDEKDVQRIMRDAEKRRPTRANLDRIKADLEGKAKRQAQEKVQKGILPQTKSISKAYFDLQKAKIQRTYLSLAASLRGDFTQRKMEADRIVKASEFALRAAKEKRIAQIEKAVRPAFKAVKVLMPDTARRLGRAREEMVRIASYEESKTIKKEAMDRLYSAWKSEYVDKPIAALQEKAKQLETPIQKELGPKLQEARNLIQDRNLDREIGLFQKGAAILSEHRPSEAQHLDTWKGREAELVSLTVKKARGEGVELSQEAFDSAVKAGKLGSILDKEQNAKPISVPKAFEKESEDLQKLSGRLEALGVKNPFTKESLTNSAPAEVRKALDRCRESGLLEEGSSWAFKGGQARGLAQEIEKGFGKDIDASHHLTDKLMERKPS